MIKAEEEYKKLLERPEPIGCTWGMIRLGELYLQQGRFEDHKQKIKEGIDQAVRLGQEVWTRAWRIGLSYVEHRLSSPERALEELNKAWDSAVKDEDLSDQSFILHYKGLNYRAMKSIDKAQDAANELRKTIEQGKNKNRMSLYDHLMGMIEHERENYAGAISYFKKGLALLSATDVRHIVFADSLGETYYASKDLDKAYEEYEKITSLTVGKLEFGDIYAKSFYMLGKIFEKKGNKAKATENYGKFLDLWKDADQGMSEIEDARKRLAGLKIQ